MSSGVSTIAWEGMGRDEEQEEKGEKWAREGGEIASGKMYQE